MIHFNKIISLTIYNEYNKKYRRSTCQYYLYLIIIDLYNVSDCLVNVKCKCVLLLVGMDRMKDSLTVDIKGYAHQEVLIILHERDINITCPRRS